MKIDWYSGAFSEYKDLPWFHDDGTWHKQFPMPWMVVDVHPCGYIVFQAADGDKFKWLNKLVVVIGDIVV